MLQQIFYSFTLFFMSAISCLGQTYYAVHVQGKIYNKTAAQYLRCGDKVEHYDSLEFSSSANWAVLVGDKGNLFLQNPSLLESDAICYKVMQPIISSSSNTNNTKNIDNLQAYFEGEQFVFIGNDFHLTLNAEQYPLSDSLFLIYRYEYNERHITVKIPYTKQTLSFNPEVLYTYKGEKIPHQKTSNTSVYAFNAVDNMPYYAAKFNPIWLSDKLVKDELTVLKKVYLQQGKTLAQMNVDFFHYILDVYGKTDEAFLNQWISTHLK